jgi:predicted DNA-binding protein (MmcQ/YjbR family)
VSYLQQLHELALSFEGAWPDFPWGHEQPVYKNAKGKIFLFTGEDETGTTRITVKLTPDEGSAALLLPFVSVAAYVGRYGWVTAMLGSDVEWEIARPWVARSYELVTSPGRTRATRSRSPKSTRERGGDFRLP